MPLDPVRIADTRAWLVKMSKDVRGAAIDLTAEPPLLEDVMFHCQQAVEKALKAFLTWHDQRFRKTHDLVEVGGQCIGIDSSLETLLKRAAPLTEYAWKFRYPGEVPEPTEEEAESALALTREVIDAILARLPEEVKP